MMFGWSYEGNYQGGQPQLFIKLGTAMNDAEGWGCLGPERAQTLIVLANYVDPMGIVFPGNKELAKKLRISEKAAQERVSALLGFRYIFDDQGKMQEVTDEQTPDQEGRPLVVYCDREGNILHDRERDESGRWKKRYLRILAPIRFGTDAEQSQRKGKGQLTSTLPSGEVGSSWDNAKGQLTSTLRPATSGSTGVELEPHTEQEPDKTSGLVHSSSDPQVEAATIHSTMSTPGTDIRSLDESDTEYTKGKEPAQIESSQSNGQATEEQPPDKVTRVIEAFADIVDRKPTKLEMGHLMRLINNHDWWSVELALNELLVQQNLQHIKSPTRYLEGVLENWQKEGPRHTDIAAHLNSIT